AKDPHRHDRCKCFCNHETQSGLCWLQLSVQRTRAFRENQYPIPRLENTNQSLDGAAIHAFLINRDHIQLWQKPAKQRHVQKRSPGQKVYRPIASSPRKRRIEITLVVHCENHRPLLNHALPMNYAETKKQSADQTRKVIAKPVVEIHLTTERFSHLAIC